MHYNNNTCRSCQHWDKRYPENQALGDCARINHTTWVGAVSLSAMGGIHSTPPVREAAFPIVRTAADFGCIAWWPRLAAPGGAAT